MNRILGPDEILQHGDLAIADDGGEPVPMNGWERKYLTPRNIMKQDLAWMDLRTKTLRTFRIIRMERPTSGRLDIDYILSGLEEIRKELWTEY